MTLLLIEIIGYTLSPVECIVAVAVAVGGISAFLKAVKDIYALGWRPAYTNFKEWALRRRTRKTMNAAMVSDMAELKTMVSGIAAELKTNGGSTVKDMVCRIGNQVEHIQARVRHQDETNDRPIFELDARGHMTFANCAFRNLVNAEEQELSHRTYVSRVHANDRTRFIHELEEAIENKMPIDSTVSIRYDDSGFVTIRLLANPDVRPGGELIGFFGTASKVSN